MEKPIRVLQVGDWDFGRNGIATLIYNFNQNLDTQKVVFDYIISDSIKEVFYKKNIEKKQGRIFELEIRKKRIVKKIILFFKLRKFLKNNVYKIVHIHESTAYRMLYYSIICKMAGVNNIILHSHSSGFDSEGRKIKFIIHSFAKLFLPLITKNYFACSSIAAEWIFLKKYRNKVIIINNGIDTKKFRFNLNTRNKIRNELKLKNNFIIGHVGRMSYSKNHEFIIECFKKIKKKLPESKLLLIGTGPLETILKDKVKKLELDRDIIFLGMKKNIEDYYQAMDLFLLPSYFEGLGIVGIEAQASGLFSVFSDTIPKEILTTINLCKFISLKDKKEWIETIILLHNKLFNHKRDNYYMEVKKNGYDIKECTLKLIDSYFELVKK